MKLSNLKLTKVRIYRMKNQVRDSDLGGVDEIAWKIDEQRYRKSFWRSIPNIKCHMIDKVYTTASLIDVKDMS